MSLVVSTAFVFGLAKAFDKLAGVKIPCRELLFFFLTLFPAPGAAVTQALADQSSIQVVVHTNINASTSMVAVNDVASWAQLVTACAPAGIRANITLSPAFQMGAYTNSIRFKGQLITIFGNNATFDAGQNGSFFNGDGSQGIASLELHDITLKNGQAMLYYGGAITAREYASVELYNCIFESNTASEIYTGSGAVVVVFGATAKIYTCTFKSNTAGAIAAWGVERYEKGCAEVEIYTSTFESNRWGGGAGAISITSGGAGVIYDSTFDTNTNTAGNGGGAILVSGSLAAFNCTFHGNTALAGGAVYVDDGANATFTGCVFNGNDGTRGHNDIARSDDTSNVTFACANGTVGAPVTMKAGESEIANPPPTSLKCAPSPIDFVKTASAW
jgi:hypothetical protein